MDSPGEADDHPRVQALIRAVPPRRRGDAGPAAVDPDAVAIEAVGFRRFGDDALVGVVLTPWFVT